MLTAKEMIAAGIKPGELFGKLLKECSTLERALALWNEAEQKRKDTAVSKKMLPGSVWEWLVNHQCLQNIFNPGLPKLASSSEKRRWLEAGSVLINGKFPKPDDMIDDRITELVFFPNSKNRITML